MWLPRARPQPQQFGPQCAAGDSAAHTPQLFRSQGSLVVRVAPQRGTQVGGASNRGAPRARFSHLSKSNSLPEKKNS